MNKKFEIPHVIHYCWFGGNPLGSDEQRCIKSWRKFLPDYEIKRWDESNFDVRSCAYVAEAYDSGKWAFVSDYARFKILYEEGGLYFDTDVELISSIDDIVAAGPFMGCETDKSELAGSDHGEYLPMVAPGLGLGVCPGNDLYREILDSYEEERFLRADGSNDLTTVVIRVTSILAKHGLHPSNDVQNVGGVLIYPAEYFNPKDYWTGNVILTGNTRSIHHYKASWHDEQEMEEKRLTTEFIDKGISIKVSAMLAKIVMIVRYRQLDRLLRIMKRKAQRALKRSE